jgi:hypothetical protein
MLKIPVTKAGIFRIIKYKPNITYYGLQMETKQSTKT